jgi:galactose-1-phosphate uridylyltransferase (family 1)
MPVKRVEDVLWAFRDRILDLKQDRRFKYIMVFKNHGEPAGASLEHPHSQLIALPILPKQVVEELEGAKRYFANKERCIYCDIIRQEMEARVRIAAENQDFITISPYAPRFPFETWILPKRHESVFENSPSHFYENLACMLRTMLIKSIHVLDNPPYNLVLHTSPIQENTNDYYHWHLEIIPGELASTSTPRRRKRQPNSCAKPVWKSCNLYRFEVSLRAQRKPRLTARDTTHLSATKSYRGSTRIRAIYQDRLCRMLNAFDGIDQC